MPKTAEGKRKVSKRVRTEPVGWPFDEYGKLLSEAVRVFSLHDTASLFSVTHQTVGRDLSILKKRTPLLADPVLRKMAFFRRLLEDYPDIEKKRGKNPEENREIREFFRLAKTVFSDSRWRELDRFSAVKNEKLGLSFRLFMGMAKKGEGPLAIRSLLIRLPQDINRRLRMEVGEKGNAFLASVIAEAIIAGADDPEVLESLRSYGAGSYRTGKSSKRDGEKPVSVRPILREEVIEVLKSVTQNLGDRTRNAYVVEALRKRLGMPMRHEIGFSEEEKRNIPRPGADTEQFVTVNIRTPKILMNRLIALAIDRFGKSSPTRTLFETMVRDYFKSEGWKDQVTPLSPDKMVQASPWIVAIHPYNRELLHRQAIRMNLKMTAFSIRMMLWWLERNDNWRE